jgi:uridine phosphorylase
MGAPSTEIVLTEIAALAEVDTATLTRHSLRSAHLTIVRVGTSGALQRATPLGTAIVSSHAVGLDSTAWFYGEGMTNDPIARELAQSVDSQMEGAFSPHHPARGKIHSYGAVADTGIVAALSLAAQDLGVPHEVGVTVTASGFFAPQGRDVSRVAPSLPDFDRLVARDPRFLNMDMETAFVLHFCGALGYRAGAICVAAANRECNTFSTNLSSHVSAAVRTAIVALSKSIS